ncbi:post-GPI attachment to proteins factor 6-like isoform X1 [Dermatophagoides farinae]|uniref:post-GPI attachment to proteins factor 6-like isoform X1 n=1 Tax=Dermatophagoides farinae TaxID=6954 RepID=UPI003F604A23
MFLSKSRIIFTLVVLISIIEIIACIEHESNNDDTTSFSILDILAAVTSPTSSAMTTTTTTTTIMPPTTISISRLSINQSALIGDSNKSNNTTISSSPPPSKAKSSKTEFVSIMDGLLLVFSNLSLLPAIYIAIKGQFYAESIIYCLTMIFSALYHLCDCHGFHYCIFPYDMLQFGDFFTATLTLWCTAIIISNVPYQWISSFHLVGATIFGTLLHFWMTGTWSFVVPAISTLLLIGSYWGYRYYRERTLPELIYSNNFYVAIGLMVLGSILFASQTIFYFRRLYGISHSLWHISMSLAIALLLPRYQNIDSFWTENLKINSTNESNQPKPPIIAIGKSINEINNNHNNHSMVNVKNLAPAPPPPTTASCQQHNNNDIMNFNSQVNKAFAL